MPYAFVQSKTLEAASGTPQTVTFDSNVTAGNLMVLVARFTSNNRAINSVTGGGTWTATTTKVTPGSSTSYQMWHCLNATGGATTITVAFDSGTVSAVSLSALEYSGIKTSSALIVETETTFSAASSPQSVTANVTVQPALVIAAGFMLTASRPLSNPTGYTSRTYLTGSTAEVRVSDKRVTATGNESPSWTYTGGTGSGGLIVAAFEEAVTGPTITVQPTAQTKVLTNANTATFSVTATGTGSLSYDWELEDGVGSGVYANVANGNGATWTGQAAASLVGTFTAKTLSGRRLRCNVTDDNGTTTTNAVALTLFDGPQVTTFPATDASGVSTATLTCDYVTGVGEAIEVAIVLPDGRVAVTVTTT